MLDVVQSMHVGIYDIHNACAHARLATWPHGCGERTKPGAPQTPTPHISVAKIYGETPWAARPSGFVGFATGHWPLESIVICHLVFCFTVSASPYTAFLVHAKAVLAVANGGRDVGGGQG